MPAQSQDLIVNKANLSEARIVTSDLPDPLPAGHALLRIDSFALTANNITYGVAGDQLGYWDFFPTAEPGSGRIPVWGFATVVTSAHPEVAEGSRLYGYLPMSSHVVVQPDRVNRQGFLDAAPHRAERAPIYNHYSFTQSDPMWHPEQEALIALFRPLFTTSFLLEDFHREKGYFGAEQIILSSASSKTAIGLAHLLHEKKPAGLTVLGLTSPANKGFVDGLGCYDRVLTYEELPLAPQTATAFVDMAGNAELRAAIHRQFGQTLRSSRAVGMTHWQDAQGLGGKDLPGPRPEFFFAPHYAQERIAALGSAAFQERLGSAWQGFIEKAGSWFEVAETTGADPVLAQYQAMLSGRIAPHQGHVMHLQG